MPRIQRVAQYFQRLGLETLFEHDERDERPDDAPNAPAPTPRYEIWNASSFSGYVPFRGPTNDRFF
jgi:hypothetical protein